MIIAPSRLNRVLRGDSLYHVSELPDASIGAIISDPPFFTSIGRVQTPEAGLGEDPWSDIDSISAAADWCSGHMAQWKRKVRKGGAIVVMAGVHSSAAWMQAAEDVGLAWMAEMLVLWNSGRPRANNFGSLHTHILWFARPGARHTFNWHSRAIYSNILVATKIPFAHRQHVAQKPIELTTFLISLLTKSDDVIVDPFCGSGSTLVSAEILERPWIGMDLEKKNVVTSKRRAAHWEVQEEGRLYLWNGGKLTDVTIEH